MKRLSSFLTITGALIVAAVIIGMTVWMSSGARDATDQAVEQVSSFYLHELASRRSQSVSGVIDSRIGQMKNALKVLSPEDLASQESLRSFIGKVQILYGLDLLAFVDEEDVVYTQYATYMGGSRYDFLSRISSEESMISTINLYGVKKQICIAIPIQDLSFMGKGLKACFIEVNIDDFIDTLAFDAENNDSYFRLYHRNGQNLTNLDFGPIDSDANLLTVMKEAVPAEQWDQLKDDFEQVSTGGLEFEYEAGKEELYYTAIPGTNWMMCVLIPESLIYDQISGINEETLARSRAQIVVSCLALLIYFLVLFLISHKRSARKLEEEKHNTRMYSQKAQKSEAELGMIRKIAVRDSLTGTNNKYAYMKTVRQLDESIRNGTLEHLALLTCDLNGLKRVNDVYGHLAGDEYIKSAGKIICNLYKHSAVYRIGGDEFVVIIQSMDYDHRHKILAELNACVEENIRTGKVVIAAGMAEYQDGDEKIADIFQRADRRMYERKRELKKLGAGGRN